MIVHKRNYIDLLIPVGLTALLGFFHPLAGFASAHLLGAAYLYLRDYRRHFAKNEKNLLSPIDGKVMSITNNAICPYLPGLWTQVAIQTNLLDSHTQYAPIEGNLVKYEIISNSKRNKISDILSAEWLPSRFDFTIPVDFLNNQVLVSQVENATTGLSCVVETIVDLGLLNLLPGLDKVLNSPFVDQGTVIGLARLGYGQYVTNVYLDQGLDIQVLTGQVVVGSETVIASSKSVENNMGHSIASE